LKQAGGISGRRPSGAGSGTVLIGALILWLCLGGCCSPPAPPAEKFFDRTTPTGTLKGFVYAVDTHQWDYAYESLSSASREEVGRITFQVAILYLNDPVVGEVPLYDLISSSLRKRGAEEYAGDVARMRVITKARNENGSLVLFPVDLYFCREEKEWRFDLMRSLGR